MDENVPRPPPNDKKERNFFFVTYTTEEQIEEILDDKKESINHWAYAYHDLDKYDDGRMKEPHWHVLIKTHNALDLSTVLNWFSGCTDENNEKCNTFCMERNNFGYCFRYLWHGNKADKDKFQYSYNRVRCDDVNYFKKYQLEKQQYDDKLLHAVHDLLMGKSFTECVYKYGRDFIIHEKQVLACYYRMKDEIFHGKQ